MNSAIQRPKELLSSARRAIPMPPAAMTVTVIVYLLLSVGLAILMGNPSLLPIVGLVGAITINLVVLLFVRSEAALPLYLVVAGPSVALSLSSSGILSRLYIGNLLFFLLTVIWIIGKLLSQRKAGRWLLSPALLLPLLALIFVGLISMTLSHLFPDPYVTYSFPHASTSIWVVNAAEVMLLIGLPLFLVVVPGVVHTTRHVRWALIAYMIVGSLYALGTIFAAPLGLYSKEVILGIRRPEVFGSVSSGLGTLLVLFASIALCQALYHTTRRARIIWGVLTALFSVGAIMTIGRESWIALFLAIMTIVIVYTRNWKLPILVVIPLIPLLLVSGATNFYDPSHVYGTDRLVIWQDAITIWQHSPIIGIGAGNYQFFDIAYGKDVVGVAHNQYLQVLAEMGVLGFACLLWVMGATTWVTINSFRKAKTALGKSLALAYLAYFVSIIFGGFFTSSFVPSAADGGGTEAFVSASYRWLLLGLVLSIPTWERELTPSSESIIDAEPQQSLVTTR
ncbi:MAG TPA: O-antigen ligase family protein [Ktedonobacteraceae bacterium]|nr:O-antigen ligase family protein [Ktedonobacteraceae bacterium]